MPSYHSTTAGSSPVLFDQAVLQGFASDGGLFVPGLVPTVSRQWLKKWQSLGYVDLAREVLGCYIDPGIVPERDLGCLLEKSFAEFDYADPPLVPLQKDPGHWIMELFHGPTLSFKDVAMGFMINVMEYFLDKNDEHLSLILATTGDTGPAAAYAAAGRSRISCWPLYPARMISREQELQMTSIGAANICPVEVAGCRNGGDDLDVVVARLFGDKIQKQRLKLSSVNSINIGRVLMQTVHYFFGYFQVAEEIGQTVVYSVPAGAFGNLCAGELARAMGLPLKFICATNRNRTLHRIFADGIFAKSDLQTSLSSAIDIVIPYNFWRFLYLRSGGDSEAVREAMREFEKSGSVAFTKDLHRSLQEDFVSTSVSDQQTLETIRQLYERTGYLVDPHGAVALSGVDQCRQHFDKEARFVSLATAHPAKFPEVVKKALAPGPGLPAAAFHQSLEKAKQADTKKLTCTIDGLEQRLVTEIEQSLQH